MLPKVRSRLALPRNQTQRSTPMHACRSPEQRAPHFSTSASSPAGNACPVAASSSGSLGPSVCSEMPSCLRGFTAKDRPEVSQQEVEVGEACATCCGGCQLPQVGSSQPQHACTHLQRIAEGSERRPFSTSASTPVMIEAPAAGGTHHGGGGGTARYTFVLGATPIRAVRQFCAGFGQVSNGPAGAPRSTGAVKAPLPPPPPPW